MDKLLKIGVEGDELVIRLKKKDLVFLTENKPQSYYDVMDEDKFLEQFVEELKRFRSRSERNDLAIEDLFDDVIDQVFENDPDGKIIVDTWYLSCNGEEGLDDFGE